MTVKRFILATCTVLSILTPANAGRLTLLGAGGVPPSGGEEGGGGGGSFALLYQDSGFCGSGTNPSCASLAHGANKQVVIALEMVGASGTVDSISYAGTALSRISGTNVCANDGICGDGAVDFWMSSGPISAASGSIDITSSGAVGAVAAAIYDLTAASSIVPHTAQTSTSPSISVSNTLFGGGVALIGTMTNNGSQYTYSSNVTVDTSFTASGLYFSFGHTEFSGFVHATNVSGYSHFAMSATAFFP